MVTCPSCRRDDVQIIRTGDKTGNLGVHYASSSDKRPCPASYQCPACAGTGYVANQIATRCTCAEAKKLATKAAAK